MSALPQVYLINQATFAYYEDISMNVKPNRILAFVKKAQDLDLRILLGHPLWNDFIGYILPDGTINPTAPQPYQDLLNGSTYIDIQGYVNHYEGMIPALVYFTFARFIEADGVHYTATGPVYKDHDQGKAISVSDNAKLVSQQRSTANAHWNEVIKFIWDNKADFPLYFWNKNQHAQQPGPRFSAIDRTKYNSPGGNTGINNWGLGLNEFLI